jgi:hypothetical protein
MSGAILNKLTELDDQSEQEIEFETVVKNLTNIVKRGTSNPFAGAAIYATHLTERFGKTAFDTYDLMQILGFGENTVRAIMNRPDFPTIREGAKYVVTAYELALWMTFRRKELWKAKGGLI